MRRVAPGVRGDKSGAAARLAPKSREIEGTRRKRRRFFSMLEASMQKKFGIVVVAAIVGSGNKQQSRPGVSKASRRRTIATQPGALPAAA